ncbi:MAG: L-threonylcarbamoyladenylate synthase [Candidatus Hydrothermarchaeota archaeon]
MRIRVSNENFDKVVFEAFKTIKKKGIVVYPTDTVYGLGTLALDEECVRNIYKIKKRYKPVSIAVSDVEMAKKYGDMNLPERFLNLLPGPYTFLVKKKPIVPDILTSGSPIVGIRIPNSVFCKELIDKVGEPITTTSANISGGNEYTDPERIEKIFNKKVDLIIDMGKLQGEPSTIVDFSSEEPKIVRKGEGIEKLLEVMERAK